MLAFDCGSNGNPGPAGAGCCLTIGAREVWHCTVPLRHSTNNVAEYAGALMLLIHLCTRSDLPSEVTLLGDSQLVFRQLLDVSVVTNPLLIGLHRRCKELLAELTQRGCRIQFLHVLRALNTRADYLSNVAMSAVEPAPPQAHCVPEYTQVRR